jgi:DNA-binding MarR family transcriptional regulator
MKRESLVIQKKILKTIKSNSGITMSELERKIGTNPASLKRHCEHLEYLGMIKIRKEDRTTKLIVI